MNYAASIILSSAAFCMLAACTEQQPAPYAATQAAQPRLIQETVPAYSSTIPAQTYYFNPARAGSAGN